MLTVGSYTLLSQAPAPGRSSRAAVQAARRQTAASVVALPKLNNTAMHASNMHAKHTSVSSTYVRNNNLLDMKALVHPKFPPTSNGSWRITEDKDRINLWFYVEQSMSKDKLEVGTEDGVLLIRYIGDSSDDNPASLLDVRLLMPPGYDGQKVEAELEFGSLQVTIAKPRRGFNEIPISEPHQ
ncbi:hypothetical protein HU200_005755 [Digitaria exilis]|uniref:SHSP domain-containing protein n=1 Tax=Digitaria exilis TaxID=1010633 RepID=A0A835KTY6_9POAL|nr:hypothetical protein HU200_005755 [Digitaria exilis]